MASRCVYIFGAGASAACGIPVAKDILRAAVLRLCDESAEKAREVHKLLAYLYPAFDKHLRTYPNIEDFLNLLEMAKQFNSEDFIESSIWPESRLNTVSDITLKAVTDYLWDFMENKETYKLVRDFAEEAIKCGDVIITFNWDTTLEHALHLHRDEPTFVYKYSRPRKSDELTVLKPHGSIDWFRMKDVPKGTKKQDLEVLDNLLYAFTRFDFRKNPKLAAKTPVIVPPRLVQEFRVFVPPKDVGICVLGGVASHRSANHRLLSSPRRPIRSIGLTAGDTKQSLECGKKEKEVPACPNLQSGPVRSSCVFQSSGSSRGRFLGEHF